jgi:putative membrane protein
MVEALQEVEAQQDRGKYGREYSMIRTTHKLTPEDCRRIEAAVAQAEEQTSAEIVPAVASSSGRYDRAEDIIGLIIGITAMSLIYFLLDFKAESIQWETSSPKSFYLLMVLGLIGGYILGVFLGSRVGWLRLLFTPRKEMQTEVVAKSKQLFFDGRVHHTKEHVGMLFYISVYERMVSIRADETALNALGQKVIDQLCEEVVLRLKKRTTTEAFCESILLAGEKLSKVLPKTASDINEAENTLIIVN